MTDPEPEAILAITRAVAACNVGWKTAIDDPAAVARAAYDAAAPIIAAHIADLLDDYAGNYPVDVFPPASDSRDAIGGTAMRHAYRNAAAMAREAAQ